MKLTVVVACAFVLISAVMALRLNDWTGSHEDGIRVVSQPEREDPIPSGRTKAISRGRPSPGVSRTNRFEWYQIESADYREYIHNLRRIGCPERTISDIIVADVRGLFELRRRAALAIGRKEYWRRSNLSVAEEHSRRKELLAILAEEQAILDELLGAGWKRYGAAENPVESEWEDYGVLSDEKRSKVREIEAGYEETEAEVLEQSATGGLSEADQAKLKWLKEQRDAELAKALTPTELSEYELRISPIAEELRQCQVGFDLTEAEFRRAYEILREFDAKLFGVGYGLDAGAWEGADAALQDRLKELLGEDRYQKYARAQDPNFVHLADIAAQHNQPTEVVEVVYDAQSQWTAEAELIARDVSLSEVDRKATLQQLYAQAEQEIRSKLGVLNAPELVDAAVQRTTNIFASLEDLPQ